MDLSSAISGTPFVAILFVILIGGISFLSTSDAFVDEAETICREEMALVKRVLYNDYICTDELTAVRWNELGIGEIISLGLNNNAEIILQNEESVEEAITSPIFKLASTNVPAKIPLHQGYYNGGLVYFIITDSSEQNHANIITENQGWQVELAPSLEDAPNSGLSRTYIFTNGISGDGIHGFQGEVFTSTPAQPDDYSALTSHIHVTWNSDTSPYVLDSEDGILLEVAAGHVSLSELNVILNMPQIIWPEGQMTTKEDRIIANETPFEGGQIVDIDKNGMTVTFVAHRGWGPDGKTIYYILADGTASESTKELGLVNAPNDASLIEGSMIDLFQFTNGINSTAGMFGFQPAISSSTPGDSDYSPMCRINLVDWFDADEILLLANYNDLKNFKENGFINVTMSQPMNSEHIMNCPVIDPFQ